MSVKIKVYYNTQVQVI